MRNPRRERLYQLVKTLEKGSKKNKDLRDLSFYKSPAQVESDCILLYENGIIDLEGGLSNRKSEKVVLKRSVTLFELGELFLFVGGLSYGRN